MESSSCLNCGVALFPGQHYCPDCGQRTDTGRLTFRKLGYDFIQSIIKIEKGIFALVKGLSTRPGETAIECVKGRRKAYFSPITFMGLCVALMLLINNFVKPYTTQQEPAPHMLARITDTKTRELYLVSIKRINEVQRFATNYMNTISVLISPWFAFFLWLFYKRRGRNMAEISVAFILFSAFSNVIATIIFSPLIAVSENMILYNSLLYGSMFLQTLYVAWGMKVFLGFKTPVGYWKVLGVLSLAGLIGFILIFIGYFFYVYRGEYSTILKYL